MRNTIERDLPVLIVEDNGNPFPSFLSQLGYQPQKIRPDSPNLVFIPDKFATSEGRSQTTHVSAEPINANAIAE
jgi:hypothetical protein